MISRNRHTYWIDATQEALDLSMKHGHAWVVNNQECYRVRYSESVYDAPKLFSAEFKDGIEQ